MSEDRPADPARTSRRARSARYPAVSLGAVLEFCARIDDRGLDGVSAAAIAAGLGYSNVRTNTFSSSLSSARQFGLLHLAEDRYTLSALARSILHPVDALELPGLYGKAFLQPPLYASLVGRYGDRRLPEAAALANVLYHHEQITLSARQAATEAFLESARFAGFLGADGILRLDATAAGPPPIAAAAAEDHPALSDSTPPRPRRERREPAPVRIDLRLWGADDGKVVRVRAPESMTRASYDRLLAALNLHVRIIEPENG